MKEETKEDWMNQLDERQEKELSFARLYAVDFAHGTDGHHRLLLIAKLAALLDEAWFGPQEHESSQIDA